MIEQSFDFKKIMKILEELEVPEGYEREMIVIGNQAFSIAEKKAGFFEQSEGGTFLEEYGFLPDGLIFAKGFAHRLLCEDKKILAIEFLKKVGDERANMEQIQPLKKICTNCNSENTTKWNLKFTLFGTDILSYWSCKDCGNKWEMVRLDREGNIIKSISFTPMSLDFSLWETQLFLGSPPKSDWKAVNDEQSTFLIKVHKQIPVDKKKASGIASIEKEDIEEFFKKFGFPEVYLNPPDSKELFIAGYLEQKIIWKNQCEDATLTARNGNKYEAIKFSQNNKTWSIFIKSGHRYPIAEIATQDNELVCLTFVDQPPKDHAISYFDLIDTAKDLTERNGEKLPYKSLIIPKIKYFGDSNNDWLSNMEISDDINQKWKLTQPIFKSRILINNFGNKKRVKPLKAIDDSDEKKFLFDSPFLIWFTYKGEVAHVAYLIEDHWADPGDYR
jgi:hypothetical protein